MAKKYVGKNRVETLDWLLNTWLKEGPPVCFLQGFPGVGKTDLARDLRALAEKQGEWQQAVINEIADRPTPSVVESLMELSVVLSNQGLPEMEKVLFEQTNPNLAFAMERALQRPVVIILDEAQRFFLPDSGSPLPEMNGILSFLRNRPTLRGRLLLLSDRVVEEARWSEWIPKRALTKLEPDEAINALEAKLTEAGVDVKIPVERRKEVVRDLDFNPRAIEALVGALRYETLDEIIESNPGLWAVRDREVSREFLTALERDLLERTISHLGATYLQKLRWLAVHRRSFKRQALERLSKGNDEAIQLKNVFIIRFLANFYKGEFSLNPIVREISLAHLRDQPTEFRQAHSKAADYHLRHFKAKQIVIGHSRLGESFAELRYHLTQAGRQAELREIGHRFTDHLKQQIQSVTPVPPDREELDERIGVLTVLLENGGAKGLEFHLARCLQTRAKRGDLQEALIHADRATGSGAPEESWHLLARLTLQAEGVEPAVVVIHRGLHALRDSAPLYQLGAEILACAGRSDEAVVLLKDGIKVIPTDKNVVVLYEMCADVLAKAGKCDGAVALLKEGIKVIPTDKNVFFLYRLIGEVYCRAGKVAEAISSLRDGVERLAGRKEQKMLTEALLLLALAAHRDDILSDMAMSQSVGLIGKIGRDLAGILLQESRGDWFSAAALARSARIEIPSDHLFWGREAVNLLSAGNLDLAREAVSHLGTAPSGPGAWLLCFIELRRGNRDGASKALALFLGREPTLDEVTEEFLLSVWDERTPVPNGHRICFHLPLLSPALTHRPTAIRRVQFGVPVLPADEAHRSTAIMTKSAATDAPEIYVSYAWGEDSTPEGKLREAIVDQLSDAVRASGREIGRDKERMRGGDSIERFAHEISKAKRIVAVISEKSLHSDFCLAHELFRAYRRCDYQRAEFQEKVIALVMDDAKPFLADELAMVALAEYWKDRYEKVHKSLLSIDPSRKNHDLWVFVDLMEEMVPRLPGMLAALKDMVMKRGFDAIVADQFREVLNRLPPVS